MKIVVMGTGNFAVPSFEKLIRTGHAIPILVTMPIRTRRKDRIPPPAIRQVAEENGIPIFDPEDVNAAEGINFLKTLDADMIFICDYGKILSPEVIALFPYGGVNLHGSLLPKFRGAAPINRAILAGERRLGVSLIHITPKVDAGPVIAIDSYEPNESETAPAIEAYLAKMGGELLAATMEKIERREDRAIPQNGDEATAAPKIRKEEGRIDWTASVRQIRNQFRALQPWPKTFSDWRRMTVKPENGSGGESVKSENGSGGVKSGAIENVFSNVNSKVGGNETLLRLILGPLEIAEEFANGAEWPDSFPPCGTVVAADKERGILVRAENGLIRIRGIQPAGKKEMEVGPFLSGYRMKVGDRLE